jgi:hypothetical protein
MTDTDIHSCGYYCDRPACIKAQRDEMRDGLFSEKMREAMFPYQMVKKPIGWLNPNEKEHDGYAFSFKRAGVFTLPLYPVPQKEWVGLTDDDKDEIRELAYYEFDDISNAIESKLKEKNGN